MATTVDRPAVLVRSLADLPRPRGLPFIGNAIEVRPKTIHLRLERWAKQYNSAYTFRLFNRRVVVISNRSAIETALRERPATFRRMEAIQDVFGEIGLDGVFSAEGDAWRRQRHIVAQALDAKHVRDFFPSLRAISERLIRRWTKSADDRVAIDLYGELSRYTVDVTTNFAFGYDMNTLERDDDDFQRHLSPIFPVLNFRVNLPFPYWRVLKLPMDRTMDRNLTIVKERITEMVAACRERFAKERASGARPKNLMEVLIAQERDGLGTLTSQEFYANIMTMLLAGEDTTSATLAWALHLIAQHPDVQAKLREEADAVLGSERVVATIEDLARMPYHDAVLSETMRIKPVAPLQFMQTNVATVLDGVAIPPRTYMFLLMREDLATNGTEGFDPGRSLRGIGAGRENKDFAFGGGPRVCPGRNLAMIEMKTALSTIVRNFTIEPDTSGRDVYEEFAFVMVPRGARVRLSSRPAKLQHHPSTRDALRPTAAYE